MDLLSWGKRSWRLPHKTFTDLSYIMASCTRTEQISGTLALKQSPSLKTFPSQIPEYCSANFNLKLPLFSSPFLSQTGKPPWIFLAPSNFSGKTICFWSLSQAVNNLTISLDTTVYMLNTQSTSVITWKKKLFAFMYTRRKVCAWINLTSYCSVHVSWQDSRPVPLAK